MKTYKKIMTEFNIENTILQDTVLVLEPTIPLGKLEIAYAFKWTT